MYVIVLGKFSVHDNVDLEGFFMVELYHRRDQKLKKVFGGINTVELQDNVEWLIDGGYDAQSNFIIQKLDQLSFHP